MEIVITFLRDWYVKQHRILAVVLPIILFVAVATVGTLITLSQPRIYESEARLWIQPKLPTQQSQQQNVYAPLTYFFTDPIHTVCELIHSEAVLNDVSASLQRKLPARTCPSLGAIEQGLVANPVKAADMVSVRFRSSNPKIAKDVVQAVVDSFLKLNSTQMSASAVNSRVFMESELRKAKEKDKVARELLRKFQFEHGTINLSAETQELLSADSKNKSDIEDVKLGMAADRSKLDELRTKLHITSEQADAAMRLSNDEVLKNLRDELGKRQAALFDLNPRLKDTHPRVRRAKTAIDHVKTAMTERARELAGEAGAALVLNNAADDPKQEKLLEQLADTQADIARLEARMSKDFASAGSLREQLGQIPALQTRYGELTREADEAMRELTDAESQLRQAQSAEIVATQSSNIQVIDYPKEPTMPVAPNIPMNLGACIMFGLLVAAATFYGLRITLNPYVGNVKEVLAHLQLPILGWSQASPEDTRLQQILPLMQRVRRLLSPALAGGQKRIVLAAGDTADGKKQIAAGLAMSFAQSGARVVVIDASCEKHGVSELFDVSGSAGLTDYLERPDPDSLSKLLQPIEGGQGLFVISAGSQSLDPHLLDSTQFRDFLKQLESQFDVLLIDTPPLSKSHDVVSLLSKEAQLLFLVWLGHSLKQSFHMAASDISRHKTTFGGIFLFGCSQDEIISSFTNGSSASKSPQAGVEAPVW